MAEKKANSQNKSASPDLGFLEITDTFKEELEQEKSNLIVPRRSEIPSESLPNLFETIQKEFGLASHLQALTAVSILFQQGGTARSCDGNMEISVYGKQLKLSKLRKIIKDAGYKQGERKLARAVATPIYKVCLELNLPGNLYQKIQRRYPEKTFILSDRVWLSDFQSLNEDAPPEIRTLILESFKKAVSPPPLKKTGK